jgi:hypothetical protein
MLDDSGEDDDMTNATSFLSWAIEDDLEDDPTAGPSGTVFVKEDGKEEGVVVEDVVVEEVPAANLEQGSFVSDIKACRTHSFLPSIQQESKGSSPPDTTADMDGQRKNPSHEIYWEPPVPARAAESGRSHHRKASKMVRSLLRRSGNKDKNDKNQRRRPMLVVINDYFYFF